MSLSTSGAIVFSIWRYSFMRPVVQCWKRWFRPGYSFVTFFFDFGSKRSMFVRLSEEMTCKSRSPLSAKTEVLVGFRLAEVYLCKVGIGAVVEYHTSAPPFLWQYSAISATIDWNDCV